GGWPAQTTLSPSLKSMSRRTTASGSIRSRITSRRTQTTGSAFTGVSASGKSDLDIFSFHWPMALLLLDQRHRPHGFPRACSVLLADRQVRGILWPALNDLSRAYVRKRHCAGSSQ